MLLLALALPYPPLPANAGTGQSEAEAAEAFAAALAPVLKLGLDLNPADHLAQPATAAAPTAPATPAVPAPAFAMDEGVSRLPLLDSLPLLDDCLGPGPELPWPGQTPTPGVASLAGQHQRVLLVGECNIEGGLGPILQQQLEHTPGVVVKRAGKRSTGLARPDYYNWPERIRELKAEFHPDLIIAYWGDNDCQNCVSLKGKCAAPWGKAAAWHAEYARRTAEVVSLMREDSCTAVIVGMPNMRPQKFRQGIARVNAALAEGCVQGGGVFVDAWQFNTGADGAYRELGEVNGKSATLQGKDGIHFTNHGAQFMASRIHGELKARFKFGEPPAAAADAEGAGAGTAQFQ
jgi:uncharacterized protein